MQGLLSGPNFFSSDEPCLSSGRPNASLDESVDGRVIRGFLVCDKIRFSLAALSASEIDACLIHPAEEERENFTAQ